MKILRKLITNVARLLGTENQAADIVADMQFRQDRINKLVNGEKKTTALFVVGIRPLVVAGSRSFLGSLIREAGGVNIAESVDVEYPKFSIEEVIRTDPDVILILDKECHGEDCFNQWKNHHYLKAVQKNRIHELDADLMSRPGVRINRGAGEIVQPVAPDCYWDASNLQSEQRLGEETVTPGSPQTMRPDILKKTLVVNSILFLALLIAILFSLLEGTTSVGFWDLLNSTLYETSSTGVSTIVFSYRLPRILLACIAGAGLACSGVVFQGVLRNPLADPYIIGIAAGGALGRGNFNKPA